MNFIISLFIYFFIYLFIYLFVCLYTFLDIFAPVFANCPSNIFVTADRGTTSTQVTWSHPAATDNSGFAPNVTHFGKQPGESFPAGEHNVRYLASDRAGNIGECRFKIFVQGNYFTKWGVNVTISVVWSKMSAVSSAKLFFS